jgi:hypothetical protein
MIIIVEQNVVVSSAIKDQEMIATCSQTDCPYWRAQGFL